MTDKLQSIELEDMETERFEINDLDTANWAFRKLAAIQSKEDEINQLAEKEVERIEKWKESELSNLEDSKGYFNHLLTEYYQKEKEKDSKFKLSTPYGKVTSRKGTTSWNTPNKEAVINQLENRGFEHLVRYKKEINLKDMKKEFQIVGNQVVDSNGEVLEGAYITDNPTTYTVKPIV